MSMDTTSVVMAPSRRSEGRKIDTWEVRIPDGKKHFGWKEEVQTVDIYMVRDDDSVYMFYLTPPIPGGKKIGAKTPTELKELLNLIVTSHIEQEWDKGILVRMEPFHNHTSPDGPGEHELKVEWHIVYSKKCGKYNLYVEEGDLFQHDRTDGRIIPWTQHREDTLRALGKMVHEASTRLNDMLREGELAGALDQVNPGVPLLGPGGLTDKKA